MPLPPLVGTPAVVPGAARILEDPSQTARVPLAAAEPLPGEEARYARLELHASGGIGQVWLVRDDVLGREVALKELRPDRAGNVQLEARFLGEARITGQLEHPSIVPIYNLARRPADDQPYYTMRFIRGRTLSAAVDEYHARLKNGEASSLDLLKLLGAFVSVCNALAYAHARGVIHRDLKGPNVVLGDFGEVMVLDWGLAKVVGSDSDKAHGWQPVGLDVPPEATAPGHIIGTPAYLAPEQALGRPELLDARTDIYGLGAILFEILTGGPPHGGESTLQVLQDVLSGPTPRAREVLPSVPAALDAVCARAMARDPAQRYPTAGDLAEEIRRWLAGEPVAAWPEPLPQHVQRWVARHRTLVTSAAAVVVAATALLAGATVYLTEANDRERQARDAEKQARHLAEQTAERERRAKVAEKDARDLAETKRREALAQEEKAHQRLDLAMEAVERSLTRLSDDPEWLAHEPRMEKLRRKLLLDALEFYQQFLKEESTDPRVRLQTARAFVRVGKVHTQLGDYAAADKAFTQGLSLLTGLVAQHGDNREYAKTLALAYLSAGDSPGSAGDFQRADELLKEAEKGLLALVAGDPGNRDYRYTLARCYNQRGKYLNDGHHYNESRPLHVKALELRKQLAEEEPDNPEYQASLSQSLHNVGYEAYLQGNYTAAEKHYRDAIAIRRKLAAAHADQPLYRQYLGRTLINLGNTLQQLNRLDRAAEVYQESLELREKLASDFPDSVLYRSELAQAYQNLGDLARDLKDLKTAADLFGKALTIRQEQAHKHPQPNFQRDLGLIHHQLAMLALNQGHRDQAATEFERTLSIFEGLVEQQPTVPANRDWASLAANNLGLTLLELGRDGDALKAFRKVVRLLEPAPEDASLRERLAWGWNNQANILYRQGEATAAMECHRKAAAIREALSRDYPDKRIYRVQLAMSLVGQSDFHLKQKAWAEALEPAERAAALVEPFLEKGKTGTAEQTWLSAVACRAEALGELLRLREAVAEIDRMLTQAKGATWLEIAAARQQYVGKLLEHALKLARAGKHIEAVAEVADLARSDKTDGIMLMWLARIHARAAEAAPDTKTRAGYAGEAVRFLERAEKLDRFRDAERARELTTDPDLAALRDHAGFRMLLERVGK
jgi:serine/threonine-protein kinase